MTTILDSVKEIVGVQSTISAFDTEIISAINLSFETLNQIGCGPTNSFSISSSSPKTWEDFFGAETVDESVKTYIQLKVRLLFDPPTSSYALTSLEKIVSEIETRIQMKQELKA